MARATRSTSGRHPVGRPRTSSTTRSPTRATASPTGSGTCSRRWACATSRSRPRGASGGSVASPTPDLTRGLADQLDLSRLESEGGLVLYENDAWAPTPSVLRGAPIRALHPDATDPSLAALRSDLAGVRPVRGDTPARAGAVLLSEAHSPSWEATSGDRSLDHVAAFGWANGFEQRAAGSVSFRFTAQWQRNLVAFAQVVLWLALAVFWLRDTAAGLRLRAGLAGAAGGACRSCRCPQRAARLPPVRNRRPGPTRKSAGVTG